MWSKPSHTFYGLTQFTDNLGRQVNLTLDDAGNLDKQNGASILSVYANLCKASSRLSAISLNNKQYLAFYQPGVLPGGSLVSLDSLGNVDPVSPPGPATKDHLSSTGVITAGSNMIFGVTQIQTWAVGDLIGDSQNAIVGPISASVLVQVTAVDYTNNILTISQAAVQNSNRGQDGVSATLFYPLLFVRDDVLPGQVISAFIGNGGTGYGVGNVLGLTVPALGPIISYQVNSGGSAYQLGDTFAVQNPISGAALAGGIVTAIDPPSRALSVSLYSFGTLYAIATNVPTATISGSGSGLTIDILSVASGSTSGGSVNVTVTSVGGTGNITGATFDFSQSYGWYTGTGFPLTGGSGSGATLTITRVADSTYSSGNISQGLHGVAVSFRTRSGYYTEPSALCFWECAGNRKVTIDYSRANFNTINADSPYYTAAVYLFTQANDLHVYQIPASIIGIVPSLSAQTASFNFFDTDLTGGDLQDALYDNEKLSDQAGIAQYNNARLVTWGGLNTLDMAGMDFLGPMRGTLNGSGTTAPYGWAPGTFNLDAVLDASTYTLGVPGARPAVFLFGNGLSDIVGEIWQTEAALVVQPKTAYSVRIWVKKTPGWNAPSPLPPDVPGLRIDFLGSGINGNPGVTPTTGFNIGVDQVSSSIWTQFEGVICNASEIPVGPSASQVPQDLKLRITLHGTPPSLEGMYISRLQVYPTDTPYEASVLRFSDPFNADRFDAISGFQQISKDDGQRIVCCRPLRSYFYIYKEHSMHVTFDDGQNPPSLWTGYLVDSVSGSSSPNSVVATESFLLSASRAGAYVFFGGKPTKLSQEIQTTWESISWENASTIHAVLDPQAHLVTFYVPLGSDTAPKNALLLDYTEGFGQEDEPGGRKWGYDSYPVDLFASLVAEGTNSEQVVWVAGDSVLSLATAKVYQYGVQGDLDDGRIVAAFYESSYARATPNGTSLFGGLAYTVAGKGTLLNSLLPLGAQEGDPAQALLQPQTLSLPLTQDVEVYANLESERARVRFEVNGIQNDGSCDYFQVRRVGLFAMPWAPQRLH